MRVCNFLKSRAQDIRTIARNTLVRAVETIGPTYLPFIIKEMRAVLTRGYQVGCTSPADACQTFMGWSFCYTIISGFSLECESSERNCSLRVIPATLLSCHVDKSSKSPVIFFSVSAARAVVLRLPVTEKHHGYPEAW